VVVATGATVRLAQTSEVRAALDLIFSGGAPHDPQAGDFMRYASLRHIDLALTTVAEQDGKLIWAALPVPSPGRTMLLFTPPRIPQPPQDIAARDLIQSLCRQYAQLDVHLAQVLLEPAHTDMRQFFAGLKFVEIAELVYLYGSVARDSSRPRLPNGYAWVSYSPENHRLFADAILQTYHDSLDCPGLTGLRDIEDIILGHRATGDFNPQMWNVLVEQVDAHSPPQPRAVLLLAAIPHSDAVELVYIGLTPAARGKGNADLTMQLAFHLCAKAGRRRLTLAVDAINAPALKLYDRHGMSRAVSKMALLRDLRAGPAANAR